MLNSAQPSRVQPPGELPDTRGTPAGLQRDSGPSTSLLQQHGRALQRAGYVGASGKAVNVWNRQAYAAAKIFAESKSKGEYQNQYNAARAQVLQWQQGGCGGAGLANSGGSGGCAPGGTASPRNPTGKFRSSNAVPYSQVRDYVCSAFYGALGSSWCFSEPRKTLLTV